MRALKESILVLCLVLITMADPVKDVKAFASIEDGINQFASALYQFVADGNNDNLAISPLNAAILLAMPAYGAGGDTKTHFINVLHLPIPDSTGLLGYQQLIEDLNNLQYNQLLLSNKIFIEKHLAINKNFEFLTKSYFRSPVEKVNLAESDQAASYINEWIQNSTEKRVQQLVTPADFNGCTGLVLASTIYLKSYWKIKFNPVDTRKMLFYINGGATQRAVATMSKEARYLHGDILEGKASFIVLPYQNDELSMMIIIPKEIDGLAELEKALQSISVADILNEGCDRRVKVYLPKFRIDCTTDLKEPLTNLGLADMFTTNANFAGITDTRLITSKVVQNVFIQVDEDGSQGGIAIDDVVVRSLQQDRPVKNFTIDRPFYYSILKVKQNPENQEFSALTILSGHITNPEQ